MTSFNSFGPLSRGTLARRDERVWAYLIRS
jgi:hypothetical protein